MYHVEITESAERDLLDAAIYIARDLLNKPAANRLIDKADKAALSLSGNPMRRPLVRDAFLAAKGLRSLPVNNYLLFYVVRDEVNIVRVLRFIHSRRNWVDLFDESIFEDDVGNSY